MRHESPLYPLALHPRKKNGTLSEGVSFSRQKKSGGNWQAEKESNRQRVRESQRPFTIFYSGLILGNVDWDWGTETKNPSSLKGLCA